MEQEREWINKKVKEVFSVPSDRDINKSRGYGNGETLTRHLHVGLKCFCKPLTKFRSLLSVSSTSL